MSLLKCPKCGEMFSDSYKTCPFCEEDEAFANGGKKPVNPAAGSIARRAPASSAPRWCWCWCWWRGAALYPHRQRKARRRPARSPQEPHGGRGSQHPHRHPVSGPDGSGADSRRHRKLTATALRASHGPPACDVAAVGEDGTVTALAAGIRPPSPPPPREPTPSPAPLP